MVSRLAVLLPFMLLGCGARSAPDDTSTASDSPSLPDHEPCAALVVSGPPVPADMGDPHAYTALVSATDDGSRVSVVYARKGPGAAQVIEAVTFAPWGPWPDSLPASISICDGCTSTPDRLTVGAAMPEAQPGFSLLALENTNPDGDWPSYTTVFRPAAHTAAPPVLLPSDSQGGSALARGASGHLFAYRPGSLNAPGPAHLLYVGAGSSKVEDLAEVGCAPVSMIPVQGGFLVALPSTLASGLGPCALGPERAVTILLVDEETRQVTVTASFPGTSPLWFLALLRRPEGAWLVFDETDSYNEVPGPLMAVPLSESGEITAPITELAPYDHDAYSHAAAALGSGLVVLGTLGSSDHLPELVLFDEDGQVRRTSVDGLPGAARMSLLGSPDGRHLLVGTPESVTRLSCAPASAR